MNLTEKQQIEKDLIVRILKEFEDDQFIFSTDPEFTKYNSEMQAKLRLRRAFKFLEDLKRKYLN